MKLSKFIKKLVVGVMCSLFVGVGIASAEPYEWRLNYRNEDDSATYEYSLVPKTNNTYGVFGVQYDSGQPRWYYFNTAYFEVNGLSGPNFGYRIDLADIPQAKVENLVSNLAAKVGYSNVATTSSNGVMSAADKSKLDSLSVPVAPSQSSTTRSIVTGTGATGFQVSSTRDSEVRYSSTITTTATIGGNSSGSVVLEIAPTNSAIAGDWIEVARCTNGQQITLAIALQSVQTIGCSISGFVPAGYYAKIRSINNAGTPGFAYNSGQEVLM